MRKTLLLGLVMGLFLSVNAVTPTKVAYLTFQKDMLTSPKAGTSPIPTTVINDPIIQVLKSDPNLDVTVKALTSVLATDVISDLGDYDVIIIQESFGGTAEILSASKNNGLGGALALKNIPKPFIYNKMYALQKSRALTSTTTTAVGKECDGTLANGTLKIKVESSALNNDLFKGCTFTGSTLDSLKLFNVLATDSGRIGATNSVKALNYASNLTVTGSTLLAQPAVLASTFPLSLGINYFSSGATISGAEATATPSTETLKAPAFFLGMNFGAICANGGKNITEEGLTIWRNAVYILAGLPVPSTKAVLPSTAVKPIDATATVKSVEYFTVNGLKVKTPSNGVYVKRTTFENGAVKLDKMVLAEPMMK